MREPTQTTRLANAESPVCHPDNDHTPDIQLTTKLLISIRNAEEAVLVRDAGVDWIDLKEPNAGALGRSTLSEARSVGELLSQHPQRSAALGELCDLDEKIAFKFAPLFPVLKVGLSRLGFSGCAGIRSGDSVGKSWQTCFESLASQLKERGSELIPVAYADWSICDAPSVHDVLQVARRVGASHTLIDTYVKDGRGLLDWLSIDELQHVIGTARACKCGIVLAGSLKLADVPHLLKLQPAALAVRGAVCGPICQSDTASAQSPSRHQPRTKSIDSKKVELWRGLVSQ
jgi:uncharacterized protein (UPF0264 family)